MLYNFLVRFLPLVGGFIWTAEKEKKGPTPRHLAHNDICLDCNEKNQQIIKSNINLGARWSSRSSEMRAEMKAELKWRPGLELGCGDVEVSPRSLEFPDSSAGVRLSSRGVQGHPPPSLPSLPPKERCKSSHKMKTARLETEEADENGRRGYLKFTKYDIIDAIWQLPPPGMWRDGQGWSDFRKVWRARPDRLFGFSESARGEKRWWWN